MSCSRLEVVELAGAMTRLDLSELPRLRELRIESAGGSGLARVSVAYCGRLETLELRGLEVELDLLLVDCAALRSVTVGGSKALGAAHTALKTCPTLARLTVRPSWAHCIPTATTHLEHDTTHSCWSPSPTTSLECRLWMGPSLEVMRKRNEPAWRPSRRRWASPLRTKPWNHLSRHTDNVCVLVIARHARRG